MKGQLSPSSQNEVLTMLRHGDSRKSLTISVLISRIRRASKNVAGRQGTGAAFASSFVLVIAEGSLRSTEVGSGMLNEAQIPYPCSLYPYNTVTGEPAPLLSERETPRL